MLDSHAGVFRAPTRHLRHVNIAHGAPCTSCVVVCVPPPLPRCVCPTLTPQHIPQGTAVFVRLWCVHRVPTCGPYLAVACVWLVAHSHKMNDITTFGSTSTRRCPTTPHSESCCRHRAASQRSGGSGIAAVCANHKSSDIISRSCQWRDIRAHRVEAERDEWAPHPRPSVQTPQFLSCTAHGM